MKKIIIITVSFIVHPALWIIALWYYEFSNKKKTIMQSFIEKYSNRYTRQVKALYSKFIK